MSYVTRNLQEDEKIVFQARLHWIIYARALIYAICAAALGSVGYEIQANKNLILASTGILAVLASISAIRAWWRQYCSEIAVTTRRIIVKYGFIWYESHEMALPRVESVDVKQSVFGRILGYGTIHARGVGEGIEHVHDIAHPIALRNAIITH